MCPPPRGAQGRAVAWKQTALSAHTQTFVTISRTFFFPSSFFLTGARPCGTGEKLQPMPPAAPVTRDLGNPWPQEGKREKVLGETEESGRPSLAVKNSAGTLLSLTLSPPPIATQSQTPQAALKKPEPSPLSYRCLEGGAQGSTQGQASQSWEQVQHPSMKTLIGSWAGGP